MQNCIDREQMSGTEGLRSRSEYKVAAQGHWGGQVLRLLYILIIIALHNSKWLSNLRELHNIKIEFYCL